MTYLALSLWLLGAVGMWIELGPGGGWRTVLLCAAWPLVIGWAIFKWSIGK